VWKVPLFVVAQNDGRKRSSRRRKQVLRRDRMVQILFEFCSSVLLVFPLGWTSFQGVHNYIWPASCFRLTWEACHILTLGSPTSGNVGKIEWSSPTFRHSLESSLLLIAAFTVCSSMNDSIF
jgi:hypothetical protein